MQTYFCPKCGRSLNESECDEQEDAFLHCPYCYNSRVIWRGRIIVAIGLTITFGLSLVPIAYVQTLGIVIGGALCVTGFTRFLRQRKAQKRLRDDDYEDNYDDDDQDFYDDGY
jgi:DNA-directed RNA polymerase subunit RPC12/RpoP